MRRRKDVFSLGAVQKYLHELHHALAGDGSRVGQDGKDIALENLGAKLLEACLEMDRLIS